MMIVFCDDTTCAYNDGQACKLSVIAMSVDQGELRQGKRETFNVCQNYREKENNGN